MITTSSITTAHFYRPYSLDTYLNAPLYKPPRWQPSGTGHLFSAKWPKFESRWRSDFTKTWMSERKHIMMVWTRDLKVTAGSLILDGTGVMYSSIRFTHIVGRRPPTHPNSASNRTFQRRLEPYDHIQERWLCRIILLQLFFFCIKKKKNTTIWMSGYNWWCVCHVVHAMLEINFSCYEPSNPSFLRWKNMDLMRTHGGARIYIYIYHYKKRGH